MKTLYDILDELIEYRGGLNMSSRTQENDLSIIGLFLRWLAENHHVKTADKLFPRHLQAYHKHLTKLTNHKGMPIKPNTVNKHSASVRVLLNFMYKRSYISRPLSEHLPNIKTPKLLSKSVLNHAQIKKLLRSVDTTTKEGYRDRAVLELLYTSGIRRNELTTLTLENVDLGAGVMKVMGKGRKERMVPIGQTALKWLTSYIRGVRPFQKGNDKYREVFLTYRGLPLRNARLTVIVRQYGQKAGLDTHVTTHTFRRSCATEMIRGNANIYHVKELLGHEDMNTMKHYARLTITDLKKTHAKCHPREKDD